MNSIRLVFLSMLVGIAIGAGLMAARQSEGSNAVNPSSEARTSDPRSKSSGSEGKSRTARDDGYQRVASALLSIDERLGLMEAREEANLEKQNKLVDQVRELAIALEIKSGNLQPLREARPARLEPARARPEPQPQITERAVPLAQPNEPGIPLAGEELPEW